MSEAILEKGLSFAFDPKAVEMLSRDWRLLEEEKKRLCCHPDDEQSRHSHCEHYERPEMMIGTLSAQGSSFSHCNEATQARENQSTKSISAKQSDEEIPLVAFRSHRCAKLPG